MVKQSRYTPWWRLGREEYSSYSFTISALDGGELSAWRPGRALPPGKGPPVPIVQEAGWAPEPVWTQRLEEKSGIEPRSPGRPARSQTLYWLSIPIWNVASFWHLMIMNLLLKLFSVEWWIWWIWTFTWRYWRIALITQIMQNRWKPWRNETTW
jgi:hypothetical protein